MPEGPPVVEAPYQGQPIPAEKALKNIVVLRGQEEEVKSEDEEIDAQFLAERIAADEAKERRERRQQLLREVAAEDPTEHLMKAVDEIRARPTPRMLLWEKFKKDQEAILTQAKKEFSSSKSSKDPAEGDLKRRPKDTGDKVTLKEPSRPPTPPSRPLPKKRPDSTERPWIEKAGDARKLLAEPPRVQASGDRCGTPPTLVPNPLSTAPYDDNTTDHHWETLPAYNKGTRVQREMAICASGAGRHHALQDSKGTCCFLEFMDKCEGELSERLGGDYRFDPNWKNRWFDILHGSNSMRYKFCWTHAPYKDVAKI